MRPLKQPSFGHDDQHHVTNTVVYVPRILRGLYNQSTTKTGSVNLSAKTQFGSGSILGLDVGRSVNLWLKMVVAYSEGGPSPRQP